MKIKNLLLIFCFAFSVSASSVFAQTYPDCKKGFYTWPDGCVLKNLAPNCGGAYLCQKVTEGVFIYCCDPEATPPTPPSLPPTPNPPANPPIIPNYSSKVNPTPLRPNPFDLVPEEANKQFSASKDQMTVGVAEGPAFTGFPEFVVSNFYRFITPFLSPGQGGTGSFGPTSGTGAANPLGQWLQWPSVNNTPGYFTSCYGKRCWKNADGSLHVGNHAGIDIAYGDGAGIYTAAPGVVRAAGFDSTFGYHVIIDHQNGWYTIYGHMQPNLLVSTGDTVDTSTQLGYEDSTGKSTGSHLHLGLSQGGNTTDFFMASGLTIDPCSALADCSCDPNMYNDLGLCPTGN